MVVGPTQFYISSEDYLAGEEVSPIKHEYRKGHVYEVVGARIPHSIVLSNLATLLTAISRTGHSWVQQKDQMPTGRSLKCTETDTRIETVSLKT